MTRLTPHKRLRRRIDDAAQRLALRATLTASHLLGLAAGTHLRALRDQQDPLRRLHACLQETELKARLSLEVAQTLASRFGKIPERRRPHYSPTQRFRILELRSLLGWNVKDTARAFMVCPNTILNWENAADPDSETVGSTVTPKPPVRRAADVVRSLAQTMTRVGFGGQDLVARILARAGWRLSARSVGRYRKERTLSPTAPDQPQRPSRPVLTRFVHHTWMMDVTQIKCSLGPDVHLAAVFEAHSRAPLMVRILDSKPRAREMATLFRRAARAFTSPKYLITDLGAEFTAGLFKKAVKRLGCVQRFASAGSLKATARLERFWRTLKDGAQLHGLQLALTLDDLERRLELTLAHYLCFRPHEGLQGATPLEAFLGAEPACRTAVEPSRGLAGEKKGEPPFRVVFLDHANRRFPILTSSG